MRLLIVKKSFLTPIDRLLGNVIIAVARVVIKIT